MSNQIPDTPWGKPASPSSPQPGISRVNSGPANALADKLDARSTALTNAAGTGAEIAAQGKTDITTAADGYPIGSKLTAALTQAGTALDSGIGRLAAMAKDDAKVVRTHVSDRQGIETDTETEMEETTYV